jgi:hypothetical protein
MTPTSVTLRAGLMTTKFGPFDPGGYVRGLDIEWPAGGTKQVNDSARKIEQRPPWLARWQNPQCRALIEACHLTSVFKPDRSSAP